jgi:hypothetical protein
MSSPEPEQGGEEGVLKGIHANLAFERDTAVDVRS